MLALLVVRLVLGVVLLVRSVGGSSRAAGGSFRGAGAGSVLPSESKNDLDDDWFEGEDLERRERGGR